MEKGKRKSGRGKGKQQEGREKGKKGEEKGQVGKENTTKKKVIKCFKKSGGTLKLTFLGLYYTAKIQKFLCKGKKYDSEKGGGAKNLSLTTNIHP